MKAGHPRHRSPGFIGTLALSGVFALSAFASNCAEKVALHVAWHGQTLSCDVLAISKTDVRVKPATGPEQTVPLEQLAPKEVVECYHQVFDPVNAQLRFDMGMFFARINLNEEARTELAAAANLDVKLKGRAEAVLKTLPETPPPPPVAEARKPDEKKPDPPAVKTPGKPVAGKDPAVGKDPAYGDSAGGKDADFRKRFATKNVPPRTDAQMKEFLEKRLADLNALVGGKWRMIETKHFYSFANLEDEQKQEGIAKNWNEFLYDTLARILRHKEGDKLWNNKMPIYYFSTFKQFQKFAVLIDKSPGAAYSGGYFSSEGREVHICIPFMSEHLKDNPTKMNEMAKGTLFHEGTHAFLQLSGEDVHLSRWLHEGMAQFIQFLASPEGDKDPEKRSCVNTLKESIQFRKGVLDWEPMNERPMGGTDSEGYAYAYSRFEFLYRNSDNHDRLPQMIREIKSGKTEKEAMEKVFGRKVYELESMYKEWIKGAIKVNFSFPQ